MALKATETKVEDLKVGDFFSKKNVLANRVELKRITMVRHTPGSEVWVFNYADAKTGREEDYLRLKSGDSIQVITSI